MLYPVYVHQDGAGPLGVTVPDFPGCFSSAACWGDLKRNVQEAIEVHCEGEDMSVPVPSDLADLLENPDYRNGHWVVVDIDVAALRSRRELRRDASPGILERLRRRGRTGARRQRFEGDQMRPR